MFAIADLFKEISDKSFAFFEAKAKLLQRYAEADNENNRWKIKPESADEYFDELQKLHQLKLEFKSPGLVFKEEFKLTARELNALRPFLIIE